MARKTQTSTPRQRRGNERSASASSGSRKSSTSSNRPAGGRRGNSSRSPGQRPDNSEDRRFGRGQPGGRDYAESRRSESAGRFPDDRGRDEGYRGRGDDDYASSRGYQGQGRPDWENQGDARGGRNFGPQGDDYGRRRESGFSPDQNRDYQERGGRYAGPQGNRGWDDRDYRENRPQNGGSWNSGGASGREDDFPPSRFRNDRGDWDDRGEGRSFNQSGQGYAPQRGPARNESNRGFDYSDQDSHQANRGDIRDGGYQNEDDSERYYSGRGQRNAGNAGPQESADRQAGATRTSSRTRNQSRSQGRSQSRSRTRE